jgi:hypothetical protein
MVARRVARSKFVPLSGPSISFIFSANGQSSGDTLSSFPRMLGFERLLQSTQTFASVVLVVSDGTADVRVHPAADGRIK